MATSIGPYAPVFLPGEPPSLTEKPERPQSTGPQRVRHDRRDPVHKGSLRLCPTLCDPAHCGLPGFSIRGTLQARILEHFGHYWLPYPSRALYFLLPQLPTPLSIWCCQNPCNPTSCTASAISPLWDRSKSSRAAAQANPNGRPRGRYRGGNKITV